MIMDDGDLTWQALASQIDAVDTWDGLVAVTVNAAAQVVGSE